MTCPPIAATTGRFAVVAAIGGHFIKTGCGSYLVDWIKRGIIAGLALNGSAAIHDLELAIAGKTSEDVGTRLLKAGTAKAEIRIAAEPLSARLCA